MRTHYWAPVEPPANVTAYLRERKQADEQHAKARAFLLEKHGVALSDVDDDSPDEDTILFDGRRFGGRNGGWVEWRAKTSEELEAEREEAREKFRKFEAFKLNCLAERDRLQAAGEPLPFELQRDLAWIEHREDIERAMLFGVVGR